MSEKCLHWLNPPFFVRTHHKFRKIWNFLHQKVRTFTSEDLPPVLDNPRTAYVFYGQPQTTTTANAHDAIDKKLRMFLSKASSAPSILQLPATTHY